MSDSSTAYGKESMVRTTGEYARLGRWKTLTLILDSVRVLQPNAAIRIHMFNLTVTPAPTLSSRPAFQPLPPPHSPSLRAGYRCPIIWANGEFLIGAGSQLPWSLSPPPVPHRMDIFPVTRLLRKVEKQ
jgi:hypothetical protein